MTEKLEKAISDWKTANLLIKGLEKERQEFRKTIIKEMYDQREFECDVGSVKVSYPKTFDFPMMLSEQPKKLTDRFWQTVTTSTEVFDKKEFKKAHPKIWAKYQLDMTPRVTIK